MPLAIRPITDRDRSFLTDLLTRLWGSTDMVVRGQQFDLTSLPGLLAYHEGDLIGLLTYTLIGKIAELVSLDSLIEQQGVGSQLLLAFEELMTEQGVRTITLITTNDNLVALRFYQKRGYRLSNLYPNAVAVARAIKPQIPLVAENGLPICDELELRKELS